jgi:hypothetical protein
MSDSDAPLDSWGVPRADVASELGELKEGIEKLKGGIKFVDHCAKYGALVSSADLRSFPIHRWYYYKEGFSPSLPPLLVEALGVGRSRTVVDPFAGVGTTALSLRSHDAVDRVVGVEYSPFAAFVGQAKLNSLKLVPETLARHAERLRDFKVSGPIDIPGLAAFHNPEIFASETLNLLLTARDCVRNDLSLSEAERMFFLLGVAAVLEDLSGVMKDGRALRILRGRKRRPLALRPSFGALDGDGVQATIANQWLSMIEDLSTIDHHQSARTAFHLRGDARSLYKLSDQRNNAIIPEESVGLFLYSPPYLNFLDYTEVYKLELWLLELVTDQESFRSVREGTLRSHPSIAFPTRPLVGDRTAPVFSIVDAITDFLVEHLGKPSIARVHGHYFADMYETLREQYITLEAGGSFACVVANSTFSRRQKGNGNVTEIWRVPILTDVILARLAEAAGFTDIQIWTTRSLRAKNVNGGIARESIVVGRKP